MKTQHTPGPWFQHHSDVSIRVCDGAHDSQDGCKTIAEAEIIGYDREVSQANARLIAAAPEVLYALENLLALVEGECPSILRDDHHHDMVTAAIRKAKGE